MCIWYFSFHAHMHSRRGGQKVKAKRKGRCKLISYKWECLFPSLWFSCDELPARLRYFSAFYIVGYYSASGKYLYPLTFFTFCYVTALFLNWLNWFVFSISHTQYPIMTKQKRFKRIFCKRVKIKSLNEISHVHKYSHPLLWHWKLSSSASRFHWSSLKCFCNLIGVHLW